MLARFLSLSLLATNAAAEPFSFVALGDTTYAIPADNPLYDKLIRSINDSRPAFSIHVGDTKGYGDCGRAFQESQRVFFNRFAAPLFYAPGNNEWADCWKENRGSADPTEILKLMRDVFWSEPRSLGGSRSTPIPFRAQLLPGLVGGRTPHLLPERHQEPSRGTGRPQWPHRGALGPGLHPLSSTPDGRLLVCLRINPDAAPDLYAVPLDSTSTPLPLLATAAYEGGGQISPDGRWLLHTSDESGRTEVYLRPFRALDRKWQVSTEGGSYPRWNRNGREIFFFSKDRMMSVSVATNPIPTLSAARVLFRGSWSLGNSTTIPHYDVSPDGRKFIFVKEDPSAGGGLIVVQNWFQELERLAPHR